MPYWIILLVTTVVLTGRYVCSSGPSDRSKRFVYSVAAVAVQTPFVWPVLLLPFAGSIATLCLILQFALCVYLVCLRIWREGSGRPS
jgi:hypothetical protein